MVYPVLTNQEMTTQSQRYDCSIRNGENAIPKHAGPEAKGSNRTTGLTLLWARYPFGANFNHWQVSRKEAEAATNIQHNKTKGPNIHSLSGIGTHDLSAAAN